MALEAEVLAVVIGILSSLISLFADFSRFAIQTKQIMIKTITPELMQIAINIFLPEEGK